MRTFISILFVIIMSGCATQTYLVNGNSKEVKPTLENSQAFWVEGIGQNKTINAAKICGSSENIIKVENKQTFADGFLAVITFGIYTPRTAKVYCKSA